MAGTFWVSPRTSPDFAWALASRFLFVLAYAFLVTYQAYYLLDTWAAPKPMCRNRSSSAPWSSPPCWWRHRCWAGGCRTGRADGRSSSWRPVIYGVALFLIAAATSFNGFLVGMAFGGLGFGLYMAVDLALVVDVLPDPGSAAKDLGVLNIAGALASAIAPAVAPAILAVGGGSYRVLYTVAGVCALAAAAIAPVKRAG